MSDLIAKIQEYYPSLLQLIGAIAVIATVIVRIPGVNGDAKVDDIVGKIFKVLNWLPTIGVNPRTKKLEDAVANIKSPEVKKE